MKRPILLVGGSKGGVGKSAVCMAVTDWCIRHGHKLALVECDTSNPDVFKAYEKEREAAHLVATTADLDTEDGWATLVETCHEHQDRIVVINTAARHNEAVAKNGGWLARAARQLHRPIITLWVINRQRDSLELLRDYMKAMPDSRVHVLRNLYFGEPSKYELYNGSKLKESIESKGGLSLNFPELSDRITDELYSNRISLTRAPTTLRFAYRVVLQDWQERVDAELAKIAEDVLVEQAA